MKTRRNRLAISSVWAGAFVVFGLGASALMGCQPSDAVGPPGSGGSSSGGSGSGGSNSAGSGGQGSGGTTTSGGTASGGVSGSVGSGGITAGSGGNTTTSGTGGAVTSSGGATPTGGQGATSAGGRGSTMMMTGGRGGAAMSGGTGGAAGMSMMPGGMAAVDPSAGCGKASPMTGSSGSPLTVSSHQYYVKLPSAYDGKKAYPLIMMFNPTGNPLNWAEQNAGFESGGAKDGAIRAYPGPASMANGWGASDVSFFQPFYDALVAGFCIDKARVFAAGESSGGDFASILGCEHADVLRVAVPCSTKDVSAYPLDATKRKCTGQVTAVVIQGKNDNVVGPANGPKTRDFYTALNHCGTMTQPVAGFTDTLSNCVQYQGCDAGYPVYWCQHTDPNYSNTNHGWPTFAPKMLWPLFSSY